MPRFHGVRERRPFNVWDLVETQYARLFSGANHSRGSHICNLHHNDGLNADGTMLVTGWYVRTTLPPGPARDSVLHNAVATLVVGERPLRQLSLAELALRDEKSEIEETRIDRVASVDSLAQAMHREYEAHVPPGRPVQIEPSYQTWGDLSPVDKNRWIAAADVALRIVKPRPAVVIPVRQSWGVTVDNCQSPFPSTHQIWVHVVGFVTRDVC